MTSPPDTRVLELLVDRATEGLDEVDSRELDSLLALRPDIDSEAFELAAAAVELAYTVPERGLPATLRQRVASQAEEYFAAADSAEDLEARPGPATAATATVVPLSDRRTEAQPFDATRWLGWLAAAATLAIVLTRPAEPPNAEVPDAVPAVTRSPAEQRDALLAGAGEVLRLDWTRTEEADARLDSGDVVWSTREQAGYMRFVGLPVNDPSREQYQLWIFDAEQDERYPIDGGVFDISTDGEVVVPISAKLRVVEPTLFAVTIEKPGGVVVSSRERLPLLAKVG